MTNKELYTDWAVQQEYLPIFMQPWWLDAVCAGHTWDVLLSLDEQGAIRAAMPYLLRKKWWMRWITMPPFTQFGGLWLGQNGGLIEGTDIAVDIRDICKDIVDQIKALNLHYYYQQFPISSKAVPVMKALGFHLKERNSYRIEDLHDLDKVIDAFSKSKKRQLQHSLSLHAERGMEAEDFYRFHTNVTQLKKRRMSYTREFLLVCDRKTRRNGQGEFIAIKNADGQVYAAAYLIWDSHCMYYLIPAIDPMHKSSGAAELLVLEALKLAREKGVIFDFNSTQSRAKDHHFKQFGSQKVTNFSIEKSYSIWAPMTRLLSRK